MGAKNCPETPRQKMINMMYLVLTAMLALNVAAETLHAFKIVDRSLMKSYESFTEKNKSLLDDFKFQKDLNESKVKVWYDKAEEVRVKSDDLINNILDLKKQLAEGAGAKKHITGEELPTEFPIIVVQNNDTLILEAQDDLNISPFVMETEGKGKELQKKIKEYKEYLISIVGDNQTIIENLHAALDVSDPEQEKGINKSADPNYKTWVQENFMHTPVIASITLLSKLQIDVRNAESAIIRHLYNQIDASSFKFTGLEAKVIPTATYVFQGQKYEARIFLSAVDSTKDLTAYVNGSSTPLKVVNGEAIYSVPASQLGPVTYKGQIKYLNPDGSEGSKEFKGEYIVAVPSATVSPIKMNVLYRSLKNPIRVSVPGVPSENIEVKVTNGTIQKEGIDWMVQPSELDSDGSKTKVTVYAKVDGNSQLMGEMSFRVKRVPNPKANVMQISSGFIEREKLNSARGVFTTMEDFDFDLKFEVTSFDLSVASSGGMWTTLPSKSFSFTGEMRQLMSSLGAGQKINIENIKAKIVGVPNDTERELSPIILTVR